MVPHMGDLNNNMGNKTKLNKKRFYYPDEYEKMFDHLNKNGKYTAKFMINTGSRINEARGVNRKLAISKIGEYEIVPIAVEWDLVDYPYIDSSLIDNTWGFYDPVGKKIFVNVRSELPISEDSLSSVISHEYIHAKTSEIFGGDRRRMFESFKNNNNFQKMKEIFIEKRPDYKGAYDEIIFSELIAHSGEKKFVQSLGCGVVEGIGCPAYEEMLDDLAEQFFYQFLILIKLT